MEYRMRDIEIEQEMKNSLYPGITADTNNWTNVNMCPKCFLLGSYWDIYPSNPCPRCGNKVIIELVGRWIDCRKWYHKLTFRKYGYWRLKE